MKLSEFSPSLLAMAVWQRLSLAVLVLAALWAVVGWALEGSA